MRTPPNPRHARRAAGKLAVALLLCLAAAGCRLMGRRAEHVPFREYRRVLVVEFFDGTRYTGTARTFTGLLRDQLTDLSADTDFITVPQEALPSLQDAFEAGKISLKVLVEARQHHRADAIILGRLESHSPYQPPSVHISVKAIDTARAAVLYEASEGWDARDRAVKRDISAYYREYVGTDPCRFGPHIFTLSPRYFLQYVANRSAKKMAAAL